MERYESSVGWNPAPLEIRGEGLSMTDTMIVAAVGLIAGLIAIVTPIVRLNSNIVRLTTVVEQLETLVKEKTDRLDDRITKHGKEIDQLNIDVAEHEVRIKALEK